jgi:hypothetical protein
MSSLVAQAVCAFLYSDIKKKSFFLSLLVEEGIRIPNGTIQMYRALFRRILFAFYAEVIHDDSVICNVEMHCRSW